MAHEHPRVGWTFSYVHQRAATPRVAAIVHKPCVGRVGWLDFPWADVFLLRIDTKVVQGDFAGAIALPDNHIHKLRICRAGNDLVGPNPKTV